MLCALGVALTTFTKGIRMKSRPVHIDVPMKIDSDQEDNGLTEIVRISEDADLYTKTDGVVIQRKVEYETDDAEDGDQ